jgi:hypothetical protein
MKNAWATGAAATDDNIHACDMVLHNGAFHLYWSVNKGELRQIGHAVADAPAGPYSEPVTEIPFDGRIDPQCFQDDDGRLYFYTVKFSLGNVIWGQSMSTPWTLTNAPGPLLTALQDTWEMLDRPIPFAVNEGPFVVKYRGRYYLIYNANHTSRKYGNYALGVTEASTPLAFSNDDKYRFPVLRSNRDPRHAGIEPDTTLPEVKNCGQPNLVRGPNGIEWWMVYFADRDNRRAQCVDRVHFFGRELYAEGPTASDTSGYHPAPSMPSFKDLFEDAEPLAERWQADATWRKDRGALCVDSVSGKVFAQMNALPARSCVLETVLRHRGGETGQLGVVAWDNGRGSRVLFGLDRIKGKAYLEFFKGRKGKRHQVALSPDFNWSGPHAVRIENNEGVFRVFLDDILLDFPTRRIKDYAAGGAGLFAEGCSAAFDSFTWTRGWDEFGGGVCGWKTLGGKRVKSDKKGMTLRAGQSAFKGDALSQYEFSAQINGDGGVYPAYCDAQNYLRIAANPDFTQLTVTGERDGKPVPESILAVHPRIHRAHDSAANGNNLRIVKLSNRILIFAEGCELGEVKESWPDSSVGLFARNAACTFDGITMYERH